MVLRKVTVSHLVLMAFLAPSWPNLGWLASLIQLFCEAHITRPVAVTFAELFDPFADPTCVYILYHRDRSADLP